METTHPTQRGWKGVLLTVAIALGCVGAIAALQLPQLKQLQTRSQSATLAEIQEDLETEKVQLELLAKAPTFGFDNVIADWAFLQFLQYFGDIPVRQRTDYRLSPEYFEVIVPHNPRFLSSYFFLTISTSLYAGMPERSVALMSEGLDSLSPEVFGAYFVWRNKAIDELLFLGDGEAARQSLLMAAEWADQSPTDPRAASTAAASRQMAESLRQNPKSKSAQFASWMTVLSTAPDAQTRRIAVDRLKGLGAQFVERPDGNYDIIPPRED